MNEDDRKLAVSKACTFGVIELRCTKPTFLIPVQVSLDFPLARSSEANGVVGARDLPHPPCTQMGQEHQFRSADGSGNSPFDPNMGKIIHSVLSLVYQYETLARCGHP